MFAAQNPEPIAVFKPKFRTQEILDELKICFEKGWTGLGFKTVEFEKQWSNYSSLPNSHFISSNTVGLHLALKIFKDSEGWKDGDEIITTPLTFVSTNHSILYENLSPVFADIDEYLCLDPDSVESKITPKTKAVMFVGIGGNTGQLDVISEICKRYNLRLILDAAHMAGTYVKRGDEIRHVGSEADVSIFSFQAVKNLPTADSGMICFKDKKYSEIARKLSWLGIDIDTYKRTDPKGTYKWRYDVPHVGFKYHGNSIMAAIGLVQLKYLNEDNKYRNYISNFYDSKFEDNEKFSIIGSAPYCHINSRHLYQIKLNENYNRDIFVDYLSTRNIFPGVHYIDNTNYFPYKEYSGLCPNASLASESIITLPIHLNLEDNHLEHIVHSVNEALDKI